MNQTKKTFIHIVDHQAIMYCISMYSIYSKRLSGIIQYFHKMFHECKTYTHKPEL